MKHNSQLVILPGKLTRMVTYRRPVTMPGKGCWKGRVYISGLWASSMGAHPCFIRLPGAMICPELIPGGHGYLSFSSPLPAFCTPIGGMINHCGGLENGIGRIAPYWFIIPPIGVQKAGKGLEINKTLKF